MDNFRIDITSEGQAALATALSLAFGSHRRAVAYAVRDKADDKPRRMVFFWSDSETIPDRMPLPFKMDAAGAADFAARWLGEVDYGKQPDHDGDNEKGWRVYCEIWGHVDGHWSAFVAVAPVWAMYGK